LNDNFFFSAPQLKRDPLDSTQPFMARKRSPESDVEYRTIRQHLIHLGDFLSATGQSDALGDYWRKMLPEALADYRGPMSGLRMAANDTLEMTRDLSRQAVADADEYLRQHGALTLSERRRAAWSHRIPKILARGKIRTLEEYYLLRESVLSADAAELDAGARATAERLLAEFEDAQGKSRARAV
jgi:hypothetical protein